ncbi:unnamed protein product [Rotaria sordida]|uniref:DED domain-containing protein n=1 Tax=Rotaria sordida TaxID=392033 RepID=A0A819FY84_9BILA|nr:unnamed protein product [Rotaria sordida]CAF3876531.1 unnamed protein product [Rotaria sordida]
MCECNKMDMKFRHFLLLILDDLSDIDRCRLHFVLGKQIPRRLRQSNSIENTIQIFEYLIDTGKIFTCLVEALSACGRSDWSKILKDFETTSSLSITQPHRQSHTEMTLTKSTLDEIIDDEEDSSFSFYKVQDRLGHFPHGIYDVAPDNDDNDLNENDQLPTWLFRSRKFCCAPPL